MTVINCCEELHNRSFLLLEKVTTLEREREILLEKVSKLQKDIFLLSVERKVFVDFTKRICFDCQKKVLIQRKNEKVSDIIKEVTQQTSGFSEEDSLDDKVYEHEKERRRKKRFSSI